MTDLRPIYYREARERLVGNRLAVLQSLRIGPATGTELAARMGWAVTSVRPRLCELRAISACAETGTRRNGEHEFRALTDAEMQIVCDQNAKNLKQRKRIEAELAECGYVGTQLNLIPHRRGNRPG